MNRRRFLAISAAFAALPAGARAETWRGYALGAEASVTLHGPRAQVARAFDAIPARLQQIERLFSLYDPQSALTRLNAEGQLMQPDALFLELLSHCEQIHTLTDGTFDPTVQVLWQALASDLPMGQAREHIGWSRVQHHTAGVTLAPGQSLTFNGIAQGFATDLITADLKGLGFTANTLVHIGEFSALGGPFRIGIEDPDAGLVGYRTLKNRALATSSPNATRLGHASHLMDPQGRAPLWSTVTVEADSATLADGLSTAAVFLPPDHLAWFSRQTNYRITAIDPQGDVVTL
ncbi:MAG: FAD:protein FMN transferase [Paracoccaceae bacterium]